MYICIQVTWYFAFRFMMSCVTNSCLCWEYFAPKTQCLSMFKEYTYNIYICICCILWFTTMELVECFHGFLFVFVLTTSTVYYKYIIFALFRCIFSLLVDYCVCMCVCLCVCVFTLHAYETAKHAHKSTLLFFTDSLCRVPPTPHP